MSDRRQVSCEPVGYIGGLGRIVRSKGVHCRHPIRLDEGEKLASSRERKVGVEEASRIDVGSGILVRGKDEQILPGGNLDRGKPPLVEIVGPVSQMPAAEVHGNGAKVVDLDPVRGIAVAVIDGRLVAGHELGDQDRGGELDDFEIEGEG